MRQSPGIRTMLLEQLVASQTLPIELKDVDFPGVINLANRHNLTAYDASYLWLARSLGIELVTLDDQLEKAAKAI